MKKTIFRVFGIALFTAIYICSCKAQQIDPTYQVNWSLLTGSSATPTATCQGTSPAPVGSAVYGQYYVGNTGGLYICTTTGTWQSVGSSTAIAANGTTVTPVSGAINFIPGSNVTITGGSGSVTISSSGGGSAVTTSQPGQAGISTSVGGTANTAGYPIASGLTARAIAQLFGGIDCYSDASPNGAASCLALREAVKGAGGFSTTAAYTPAFTLGYSPNFGFAQITPHNQGGHGLTLTSSTCAPRLRGGLNFYGETEFGNPANGFAWAGTAQNGCSNAYGAFGYYLSSLATDFTATSAFSIVVFGRQSNDQYTSGGSLISGGGNLDYKFKEHKIDIAHGCYAYLNGGSTTVNATLPTLGTWGAYPLAANGVHMITMYYSPTLAGTGTNGAGITCTWDNQAEATTAGAGYALLGASNYITATGTTYNAPGQALNGAISGGPFYIPGHLSQATRAQIWNNRAVQHPPTFKDVGAYSVSNAGVVYTTWPTYYFQSSTTASGATDFNDDPWDFAYARTYTNGGNSTNLSGTMHTANANVQWQGDGCHYIVAYMPENTGILAPTSYNIALRVDGHIIQSSGVGGALDWPYTGAAPNVAEFAAPCDGNTHTFTLYSGFVVGNYASVGTYNPAGLYTAPLGGITPIAVSYTPGSSFAITHPTVTGTVLADVDSIPSGNGSVNSAIDSWPQQLLQNSGANPFSGTNDIALAGFGSKLSTTDCPVVGTASGLSGDTSPATTAACKTWLDGLFSELPNTTVVYFQSGVNDYAHGSSLSNPSCLGQAMSALNSKLNYAKTKYASVVAYVQTIGNATLGTNDSCNSTSNPALTITAGSNGTGTVSITAGANSVSAWRTAQNAICALYTFCKTIDASGGGLAAGGLTQVTATCTTSNLATDICWPAPSDGCMASDNLHLNTCGSTHFATAIVKTITGNTVTAGTNN